MPGEGRGGGECEAGTDARFITLIAAVTKLPPDLHTIAFEIRRPRAAMVADVALHKSIPQTWRNE